ncbi:MAG: hypothetical protein ABI665_19485 [Vicinamibacterales bacterium]
MVAAKSTISLCLVIVGALVLPAGLRVINRFAPAAGVAPSYLPSIEQPRVREPFDEATAAQLRESRPDFVVIGDSMAGTRIVPGHISRMVGGRGVAALLYPGSSVAYWYLTFKNLVANNPPVRAKAAIFFFRDDQLTLAFQRVTPGSLDRVARDQEPVLDRVLAANALGTFAGVHRAVQSAYHGERTREWLAPLLAQAPARIVAPGEDPKTFLESMNTTQFSLETLRKTTVADLPESTEESLDFPGVVGHSLLPEIIRLSETSGVRVAFIRVQRRPTADGPPPQSAALVKYVHDLREYLAEHGAYFQDEWGDPDLPLSIYGDGDHVTNDARIPYTEHFFQKNRRLFQ